MLLIRAGIVCWIAGMTSFVSSWTAATGAQSTVPGSIPSAAVLAISLTPRIISDTYCRGDGEINVLQLHLRLGFTNASERPIILYLGRPLVERVIVGKSELELRAGNYETESFPFGISAVGTKSTVMRKFLVILKPKERYEVDYPAVLALPIQATDSNPMSGILTVGEHVLRLTLRTWPSEDSAAPWTKKMATQGMLLTESIVSVAMPLPVKSKPTLVNCDSARPRTSGR
jgi:hypothetical protein